MSLLDFNGTEIKRFQFHSAAVKEITFDREGEYLASCSDDGNVFIHNLFSNETIHYEYGRPLNSVALDPNYARSEKKEFLCGGKNEKLIFNTKGWFGKKDIVLFEKEGPIYNIKWCGNLVAWANDLGVKIYDLATKEMIAYIDRPKGSPRPDLFRCCLIWETNRDLIVGWADCVKIARVYVRQRQIEGYPSRHVEIVAMFRTDFFISGIAPFGKDLAILAYSEEITPDGQIPVGLRPELRIISREGEETSSDSLTIHDFDKYKANDYRLAHLADDDSFYILSPKDLVVAKPRDLDDHIAWLIEGEKYEEALEAAKGHEAELKSHNISDIGQRYLEYLLESDQIVVAADQCTNILKDDKKLWETWILKFEQKGMLQAIAKYIPINKPRLSEMIYEMVLNDFLKNNPHEFLVTINSWPLVYKLQNIIAAVKDKLIRTEKKSDQHILHKALTVLYLHDKQYDNALDLYIRLGEDVFDLVTKHGAQHFRSLADKVLPIVKNNSGKAIDLFVQNTHIIPVAQVVKQLESERRLLLKYLHALMEKNNKDEGIQFYDLQIELYAEYDLEGLEKFLQKSQAYNLDLSLEVCKKKNLYEEMVFIYGRMGIPQEALTLMIDKIGDVRQAIDFVQKQDDQDLWADLINRSINNPQFVSGLLENVGTHINPLALIEKIPHGMEIIGLRDRLVKIIGDYNLQTSLKEGCKDVLKADCKILSKRLYSGLRKGMRVDPQSVKCSLCSNPVMRSTKYKTIVFFCGHTYHQKCIEDLDGDDGELSGRKLSQHANKQDSKELWCKMCRQNNAGGDLVGSVVQTKQKPTFQTSARMI